MKKRVLCYGDSNTWGHDPSSGERFPDSVRWTGVLQEELGEVCTVIEEGLPGRTTVFDDPVEGIHKNGRPYLLPCLESQRPLDLVIIMLGTNDLKARFSAQAEDVAKGAGVLACIARGSAAGPDGGAPEVLLIAPARIKGMSDYAEMFTGGEEKSQRFARHYQLIAEQNGCYFLDAASVIEPSPIDGVHFEESEHLQLGTVVAERVRNILGT